MFASLLLAAIAYVSPVHYPIELAGNFGEPRPNHFHAGIDVKTDRMTGKPLYAMADGFISKVSVGTHGFGKAVYVRHPDGNTSVYVHLDDFAPQIEAAVKRYQYAHKVYATDITFPATMMPVHKGQFIGFSGNTGSSQGPHLHLELHRTQTGDLLDPLAYLKAYVHDTIAPAVYAFKAYPVPGEGTFQHGSSPRVFTFDKGHFSAWGKVGFGVRTMDHMNGVYNSFGSRLIRLYCDGRLVFSADINGLPQSMHRMMNSWGDYDHFMQSRVWFLKSFVEPGNRLPFLKTGQGKGYILFNERREYRLRYVVSDVFGNQTVREFTVLGTPEALGTKPVIAGPEALLTSRDNHWQTDGIRLDVPGRLMAVDRLMKPQLLASARDLSQAVRFVPGNVPLLGWADLAFRIPDATMTAQALCGDDGHGHASALLPQRGQERLGLWQGARTGHDLLPRLRPAGAHHQGHQPLLRPRDALHHGQRQRHGRLGSHDRRSVCALRATEEPDHPGLRPPPDTRGKTPEGATTARHGMGLLRQPSNV